MALIKCKLKFRRRCDYLFNCETVLKGRSEVENSFMNEITPRNLLKLWSKRELARLEVKP
jgi:hypothetical protein